MVARRVVSIAHDGRRVVERVDIHVERVMDEDDIVNVVGGGHGSSEEGIVLLFPRYLYRAPCLSPLSRVWFRRSYSRGPVLFSWARGRAPSKSDNMDDLVSAIALFCECLALLPVHHPNHLAGVSDLETHT